MKYLAAWCASYESKLIFAFLMHVRKVPSHCRLLCSLIHYCNHFSEHLDPPFPLAPPKISGLPLIPHHSSSLSSCRSLSLLTCMLRILDLLSAVRTPLPSPSSSILVSCPSDLSHGARTSYLASSISTVAVRSSLLSPPSSAVFPFSTAFPPFSGLFWVFISVLTVSKQVCLSGLCKGAGSPQDSSSF